jgi:hypothetical protein
MVRCKASNILKRESYQYVRGNDKKWGDHDMSKQMGVSRQPAHNFSNLHTAVHRQHRYTALRRIPFSHNCR